MGFRQKYSPESNAATAAVLAWAGAVALGIAAVWYFFSPEPRLAWGLLALTNASLTALVGVLCLIISGRVVSTALQRALSQGISFRDVRAVKRAAGVNYVVLEQTVSATLNQRAVADIIPNPFSPYTQKLVLQIAASVEQSAGDEVGASLVAEAKRQNLHLLKASHVQALTGLGLKAILDGQSVVLGSFELVRREAVEVSGLQDKARELAVAGKTVMYLAVAGEFAGLLALTNPLRSGLREAVAELHKQHTSVALLTADARHTANAVAAALGVERVVTAVTLDRVSAEIEKLRRSHRTVALVGTKLAGGASADFTVALRARRDAGLPPADLTLLNTFPWGLPWALRLAKTAESVSRASLAVALTCLVLGVPVAAGVLYPFFGVLLSPKLTTFLIALSLLFVLGNSLRLQFVKV